MAGNTATFCASAEPPSSSAPGSPPGGATATAPEAVDALVHGGEQQSMQNNAGRSDGDAADDLPVTTVIAALSSVSIRNTAVETWVSAYENEDI